MSNSQKAFAENQISQPGDIAQLGTILSIWAHPDDETYCCGGVMLCAAANGQRVVCVTATRGEAGSQDATKWPLDKLAEIRSKEMARALEIYGVDAHYWLDYPDGGCKGVDQAAATKRIVTIIEDIKPDTVLTFGSEGITGHDDHQAVNRWVHAALTQTKLRPRVYHPVIEKNQYDTYYKKVDEKINMFFAIDEPPVKPEKDCDICLCLSGELLAKKHQVIESMPSQTAIMTQSFDQRFLEEMLCTECMVRCHA